MKKENQDRKIENFEYTRQWYENHYHNHCKDKNFIDPTAFHPERDVQALTDLDVKPEHSILVCGCGGGDDTYLLNKYFNCQNVYGIDWSQPAVDFCNIYFPWMQAVQGDVSEMPYEDNSFDRVLAFDLTEHLSSKIYMKFLKESIRVTKTGGRIGMLPGMTRRIEHINLLYLMTIARQMRDVGWNIIIEKKKWVIGEKK